VIVWLVEHALFGLVCGYAGFELAVYVGASCWDDDE
jgi:hypothetical protein